MIVRVMSVRGRNKKKKGLTSRRVDGKKKQEEERVNVASCQWEEETRRREGLTSRRVDGKKKQEEERDQRRVMSMKRTNERD